MTEDARDGLRIGEVAKRAGLAPSAIRYYESEGLIPRPMRRSGQRVYDKSVVERLALIDLAKSAGFKMSEVKLLLRGFARRTAPGERWRALADTKLEELDRRIEEAEQMKRVLRVVMSCECPTLADCARAISEDATS